MHAGWWLGALGSEVCLLCCFLCEIAVLTKSIWISVSCPVHAQQLSVWRWPSPGWLSSGSHTLPVTLTWLPLPPFAPRPQTPLSAPAPSTAPHHECLFWWIFHLSWSTLIQQTKGAFSVICIFFLLFFPYAFVFFKLLSLSLSFFVGWAERCVPRWAVGGLLGHVWYTWVTEQMFNSCWSTKKTHIHACTAAHIRQASGFKM